MESSGVRIQLRIKGMEFMPKPFLILTGSSGVAYDPAGFRLISVDDLSRVFSLDYYVSYGT